MSTWGTKWPKPANLPEDWLTAKPFIGIDLASKPDQTVYGIVEDGKVRQASATEINAIYQASRVNKVPTHDPYTNPNAFLYYECKCGQILDPKVKSFAALNNAASEAGWKIRWGEQYYVPYCKKCGEGVE